MRYYDPKNGRWTQKDPLDQVTEPRQSNRYTYSGADPINLTDPSGLWFGEGVVNDVTDWTNDNLGLSGNELGGLGVDSTLGAVACWRGGPQLCGVALAGPTVYGGVYDATDDNDEWWVREVAQ